MQIEIDNLKSGGCTNTIVRGLGEIDWVTLVAVDTTMPTVRVQTYEATKPTILARFHTMGSLEKGSVIGLSAALGWR